MAEAQDSGWLGGLLGKLGVGSYDPAAAYGGLLTDEETKRMMRIRALAAAGGAFAEGAGSDARGSAIPFGATLGRAGAAAYAGEDELIKARLQAAQTAQQVASTGLLNTAGPMLTQMFQQAQKDAQGGGGTGTGADGKPKPGTPLDLIGKTGGDTYWTPQGLAALRPTEGAYDQIHYPSGSPSTASGAYGFLDSTWREQAPKAGVDIKQYPRAYLAPPEVQDKVAAITPIIHWTGADAKGNPYNFRAQRLATNPDYVTGGAQTAAVDRPVTPTEADIYRKAPFPTVQNAGVVPPPVMTDKLPTTTIAPNPFNTPTGISPAPAASGAGGVGVTRAGGSPAGIGGAVSGEKLGLLGPQDQVTQQTVAALANTRGGVNAGGDVTGGLLASLVPAAATQAAGGPPPTDPRLAQLAQAAQAGPPTATDAAPPAPPPAVPPAAAAQALGLLAQQGSVGTDKGGGLLPQAPVPPRAPAPAANTPPPVPPPAPPAAAPGLPGNVPLPPPPQFTLPPPPQMQNIPVPGVGAGTPQERMAQALTGIMALTGHPAPAWLGDMAKMPMDRATELYKAQLTQETNRVNELYKTQLAASTAEFMEAAKQRGATPYQIQQELAKQNRYLDPRDGIIKLLPGALEAKGLELQQASDIQQKREQAAAQQASELRNREQQQASEQRRGEEEHKQVITDLISKKLPEANDAVLSLQSSAEARRLLDQGVITGFGATAKVQFGKALQAMGINYNADPVANTEAYIAARSGETGRAVKPFGSGSGVSENDRKYAQGMVAGSVELNEASLRKILDISDKAHHITIDNFNYDLARRAPNLVDTLKVQKPDVTSAQPGAAPVAHPPGGYDWDPQTRTMKPRTNPQ